MRFLKARSQLLISLGEPIADPFKVKEGHCVACAKLVGSVVAYLYDVAAFVTAEEEGLGFGEVLHKEVGVSAPLTPPMEGGRQRIDHRALGDLGTCLKDHLCGGSPVVKFGCRIKEFPKPFKQAVLLLFAIACA